MKKRTLFQAREVLVRGSDVFTPKMKEKGLSYHDPGISLQRAFKNIIASPS